MKSIILIISSLAFVITSCVKDKMVDVTPIISTTTTGVALKYSANFIPTSGESARGSAKIYYDSTSSKYTLKFENFSVSSGPDLKVYLSKYAPPTTGNFINLGALKNNSGNQSYEITGAPNFKEYKYVLVHCQQYNHLFASANLNL